MKAALFSSVFAAALGLVAARVSYDGAKAMRISVGEDVTIVAQLIADLGLPTWKGAPQGIPKPNTVVDLVVPAEKVVAFQQRTAALAIDTMHEDLGLAIADEGRMSIYQAGSVDPSWFNSYHSYADHMTWLKSLQAAFPSNSEIVVAGNSDAGTPITGIHFYGSSGGGSKPAIVIHGTVHAREWITTLTVEYLAYTLLNSYASDTELKGYVDTWDFYIFPVVNPDGFQYTQTQDRLWRKNRQSDSTSSCMGRDVNRNWPFMWDTPGGSSTNPCDETYRGQSAGDATENIVLRNYLDNLASTNGVQLFMDIHSYSQLFMTPYGYDCNTLAQNDAILQPIAQGASNAIAALYGTQFQYGPVCTTIYQATGSSVDYVNDVTKSKYTFTMELRDTGSYGFVLPASQILPTGEETFAGFKYVLANMQ